nr:hypothetical protein [Tanacetum cinerariifolium]
MSDSEHSSVTYTLVPSPVKDYSDIGSPEVDGPPSPDYFDPKGDLEEDDEEDPEGEKFVWNEEREKSFEELKQWLVSAPVLTLLSGSGGFQIYSDASKKGLGCVLMQHGMVIAYASRQLKPYEYHPGKANVVADALSRKLGMIAGIKVEEEIIRDLERLDIEIYVRGQHGYWASLRIEPDLISRIKEVQKEDNKIWTIVENLDKQRRHDAIWVVMDRLTKKSGMIAGIKVEEEIIHDLERLDIELYVHGQHGYWASLRVEPDLISQIKEAQKEDSEIWTIVENLYKQVKFCLDDDNVRRQGTRRLGEPGLSSVLPFILTQTVRYTLAFKKQNQRAKAGGSNTGPVPKATSSSGLKCFNCGEPGHRQSECKKVGKRHLLADPEDNDDDVTYGDYKAASVYDEELEYKEEYVFGDVGVNLVVRRPCLTPKVDGDDWLKHNIFQSTCTILGKFKDELEIMEKMNLNAYCLKLPSHIWCSNVFNVKHLLPYHGNSFDEDCVGNSRINFVYPGGNDVNPSIKEQANLFLEAQDCTDYGVVGDDYKGPLIFDDDQFEDELEMGDDVFVVIGKEVAPNSEIPEAMFPLLEQFSDIFPDDLPDAFPPLCDIQYHIDLEPGSQFPNMLHYRLCPGAHEELCRQVEEFVSKGHIRKIMSACAQPRRPLDLMSLHVSGFAPKKVQDFVEGFPYHGVSSDDSLIGNSRKNFVYP